MFENLLLIGMKKSGLKSQTEHTFFNGFEAPMSHYVFTTNNGDPITTFFDTLRGKAEIRI